MKDDPIPACKLWRLYEDAGQPAAPADKAPDEVDLAAYLDGSLRGAERDRVEAWLAADPQRLDLLIASRETLNESTVPAPDSLVRRAADLVSENSAPAASGLAAGLGRLFGYGGGSFQPLGWAVVTGAFLLACAVGFELGRMGYASTLAMEQTVAYDSAFGFGEVTEGFL